MPLVATALIFALCASWFGGLALRHVSVVKPAGRLVELFRAATSDLNLTACWSSKRSSGAGSIRCVT